MRLCYDIGFAFFQGSSVEIDSEVLRLSMDYLIDLDRVWRRSNPKAPTLYKSGVIYDRTAVWYTTPDVYVHGRADCKSLAAARIAELREAGTPCSPAFRHALVRDPRTGHEFKEYHILVQLEGPRKGVLGRKTLIAEDPSDILGMRQYYAAQGLQFLGVQ